MFAFLGVMRDWREITMMDITYVSTETRSGHQSPVRALGRKLDAALDGPHAFLVLLSSSCPHETVYLILPLIPLEVKNPATLHVGLTNKSDK